MPISDKVLQYVTKCNTLLDGKGMIKTYTAEEVAKALKLHPYTIRRLSREGKIPAFKFGGQWRFKKDAIDKVAVGSKKRKHRK